jgi:hypothetical protein
MPVALASRLIALYIVHSVFYAAEDLVLLLQGDACNGKPLSISLESNLLGRIKISQHKGLCEGIAKLYKGPFHHRGG